MAALELEEVVIGRHEGVEAEGEGEAESAKFKKRSARSKEIAGNRKEPNMLWTIGVILIVLWLLGLLSGYTLGGVVHVLLVIALIVVVVQAIQSRRRL